MNAVDQRIFYIFLGSEKIKILSFFPVAIFLSFFLACQTVQDTGIRQALGGEPKTTLPFLSVADLVGGASSKGSVDPVISGVSDVSGVSDIDELASGFCKDDVYTTYLVQQYKKKNKNRSRRFKSRRSRRQYQKSRTSKALHYAAARLKGGIVDQTGSFPVSMNRRVEFWIRYFKTTGRRTFLKWIVRGEAIKGIISPILEKEAVPPELYYLAMVESGFNNHAHSSAAASGTWQFMKGTARSYGLKIDYWLDERRDPAKSTLAAATLLKDLYKRFGDWHLALAAYNAGPGRVSRAIRRAKTRDFWEIADGRFLSAETRNYVPKMIAALTLAAHPKRHGLDFSLDTQKHFPNSGVLVGRPIRLRELAKKIKIPLAELKKWNPELTHGITPPERLWRQKQGYFLRLPESLFSAFALAEPELESLEIKDILMHKIRTGDTLYDIARRYRISVRKILRMNPRLSPKRLRIGKQVAIPIPTVVRARKSIG